MRENSQKKNGCDAGSIELLEAEYMKSKAPVASELTCRRYADTCAREARTPVQPFA